MGWIHCSIVEPKTQIYIITVLMINAVVVGLAIQVQAGNPGVIQGKD